MERFGVFDKNSIEKAVKSLVPTNTVRSKNSIWAQFTQFCTVRKYTLDAHTSEGELNNILKDWAWNMKKTNGEEYKEYTLKFAARLVVANRFFCYDFVITMDFQRHCYIGGGQLSSWKYTQFGNPDSGNKSKRHRQKFLRDEMHASQHQHIKVNLIMRRYHKRKQRHDNIRSEPITSFISGMEMNKIKSDRDEKETRTELEEELASDNTRVLSSGMLVKSYFLQIQKDMSESL
ncbi:unnamed protein product [Psylliodes chrysocephalus]|uniref:Uncharacterized protein n=1 Tax=Psylliodes chrysocephalus TaxID=3402493 RepID=A0A9P0D8Q0_9CUCU|nr:unnamed protein product [Psylliodes chrysocephala]